MSSNTRKNRSGGNRQNDLDNDQNVIEKVRILLNV